MISRQVKDAYWNQRSRARHRNIKWGFTLEKWVDWWLSHLGPDWFEKRGNRKGQYVMARFGDLGPYAANNVRCTTTHINHAEYNILRKTPKGKQRARINDRTVAAIYLAQGSYGDIAEKYGVGNHQVECIKTKKYYCRVTNEL